eukprot:430962_1
MTQDKLLEKSKEEKDRYRKDKERLVSENSEIQTKYEETITKKDILLNEAMTNTRERLVSENSEIQTKYDILKTMITEKDKEYKENEEQYKSQLQKSQRTKDELKKTNAALETEKNELTNQRKQSSKEFTRKMKDKAAHISRLKRSNKKHTDYLKSHYEELIRNQEACVGKLENSDQISRDDYGKG